MDDAGSRTQLPGLVLAAGALLLLVFGTELLAGIPSPVIGAVVAVAVWGLLSIRDYRHLWGESRPEFAVAVVCALGVLVVGPIGGILISFVFSLVNLARRAANPPIDVLVGPGDPHVSLTIASGPGTETGPGVIILRMSAPLFFANGDRLVERAKAVIEQAPTPTHRLVLDMEGVTDIDVTGAASLRNLRQWLAERDITFAYSRVRSDLVELLGHFGLDADATQFTTNREAVAAPARPASQEPKGPSHG
jgi:MFS superfamily sulfate permease-like transporter